ncbi:MAG: phosphotransferase [Leptolyngbyaceae cyanobacterium SM1_3_5]|nr:phosphotransferase [Leptolyngbyaceae cyanobacterium SM1_3_5]
MFLLSNNNVLSYLVEQSLCQEKEQELCQIEAKICKNFNLLVHLPNDRSLLVKQEPHDREGEAKGDLWQEWKVHQLLKNHLELQPLLKLVSEVVHVDGDRAIVVINYLQDYCDLDNFYTEQRNFSPAIAAALGHTLASIHQATIDRTEYQHFLEDGEPVSVVSNIRLKTELTPDIFGRVSEEGLKFYALYQRYESLNRAIDQLQSSQESCCLTHQDLKFNNILLHQSWQAETNHNSPSPIRLIDWEKWAWGDPTADLGALIAGYLKIWLKSLGLRSSIDIHLALQWAGVPLDELQPSIATLVQAYFAQFPNVLSRFPQFLPRVMQSAGFALIESLQAKLHYREPFGNTEIGMLQVAKTLLCAPESSIATVFGISAAELVDRSYQFPATFQTAARSKTAQSSAPVWQERSAASSQWLIVATQEELLQDLVEQIQIQSDGIHYLRDSLSAVEATQFDRLQRLPADLQQQHLCIYLRNFLYGLYFSGELRIASAQLENDAIGGLNIEFFEQIQRSNQGTGYWDAGWQVQQKLKKRYAVQKEELTIFVESKHLRQENRSLQINDSIEILLPNHRMENDFYVAVGNAGFPLDDRPTLEICFHVSPAGAIALMRQFTTELNQQQIPFKFKMITNPAEEGRWDAAVLNLECKYYPQLRQILQRVYAENRSHFYPSVPLFMKAIAPGIGLAEEPEEELFGVHRCQQIAEALLMVDAQENGVAERLTAIEQRFIEQGIDWELPYLNGKNDRYESIEI